jgi:glycosyltransferase involved in cell wall biosynthesis
MIVADLCGGGTERVFVHLLRALPRDRFDIHLGLWRALSDYEVPGDIPVRVIHKSRPWHFPRVITQTRDLVDRLQPDVVFSALAYTNLLTGCAINRARHHPRWVCRLGGAPQREFRILTALPARRILRTADCVVGNSEGVTSSAIRHLRLDPGRTCTIYNPLDIEKITRAAEAPLPLARPEGRFVVVHAGRFEPCKNQALLLRGFAGLRDTPSELWILGRGRMESHLKALARRLGIAGRIRWLGFRQNPFAFYRAADCFVLSSDSEGLPNALAEAMACGTAAVSTRCPFGPGELITHNETGLLVPMKDPGALSAAMQSLADDVPRRTALAAAGARSVRERLGMQTCIRAYVSALAGPGEEAG